MQCICSNIYCPIDNLVMLWTADPSILVNSEAVAQIQRVFAV